MSVLLILDFRTLASVYLPQMVSILPKPKAPQTKIDAVDKLCGILYGGRLLYFLTSGCRTRGLKLFGFQMVLIWSETKGATKSN